jgi:hypothetical protein
MEYCGGGSVADIVKIMDQGLNEDQIVLICREALKVIFLSSFSSLIDLPSQQTSENIVKHTHTLSHFLHFSFHSFL